jgi:hypothetical protein
VLDARGIGLLDSQLALAAVARLPAHDTRAAALLADLARRYRIQNVEAALHRRGPPPVLNCDDLSPYTNISVNWDVADPDPHHLDADRDGVGCES